jgi:hypothetical protein
MHKREQAETCDTLTEAVEESMYADDHGNGVNCTEPFVVSTDTYDISVVRKHNFERGSYFLITVSHTAWSNNSEQIVEQVEAAFGMENSDVTVTFVEHSSEMTAIVPVRFRQV